MSAHAALLPARTPRSAFGKLLGAEAKYQWRVPLGLILGMGLPVVMVVIFGLLPSANTPVKSLVLAGYAAVFGFLAVRFFRWE